MADTNSTYCSNVVDNTWGPGAGQCRGGFDFTLLFEESMLTLLPLCLLFLVSPSRLVYLAHKSTKVRRSTLLHLKLTLYILFAALQLVLLVFWVKPSSNGTILSVPVAALSLFGAFILVGLSYLEHQRTVHPSTILSIFLFVTILGECARTRTVWLRQSDSGLPIVMTIVLCLRAVLLVVESFGKQSSLIDPDPETCNPEATAGIFDRLFFAWLNPLFRMGYYGTLTVEKLQSLDRHLTSKYLAATFQRDWKIGREKSKSLQRVVFKTLRWPLLGVVVPRFVLGALNFAQPFLINDAIALSNSETSDSTTSTGVGLIGAYLLVYVGIAVSTGQYWHNNYRAITMARGGLISLLYTKLSDLSMTTAGATSSLTLMSADIERITNGWQTMHEVWSNIIEIAVAIWLLERQLGAACALPLGVAIASIIGLVLITSLVVSRQAVWLEAIERRIEATTSMLKTMKGVKMCGLAEILMDKIQALRAEELQISHKFRQLLIWNMAFAYLTPLVAPVLTFAVFSVTARNSGDTTLSTARVFTSLSLFTLLSEPLASLMVAAVQFAGAAGSFKRIQEFLDAEDRRDTRVLKEGSSKNRTSKSRSSRGRSSKDGSSVDVVSRGSSSQGLSLSEQEKVRLVSEIASASTSSVTQNAFTIRAASFGWTQEKPDLLSNIDLTIAKGKFVIIVGPVGCGKSTLLKGLLGEVPQCEGLVEVSTSEIAFCDQTNWHMNGTIRESILGISNMDLVWYQSVIQACALEEDLQQLPKGDETQIGSGGAALSGGQSQRIALARALYANKRIVLLDDTMNGLDATTEHKVFHSLLGQDGLLRKSNTTVVLVSSASKRLPYADWIVALGADGAITEQGFFEDLNASNGYVASFGHQNAEWTTEEAAETAIAEQKDETYAESISPSMRNAEGDIKIYTYYIGTIGWIGTLIFLVAISAYAVSYSFQSVWVQWWSAANSEDPNGNLGYWLGVYGALAAAALLCMVASVWHMLINIMPRSGKGLHRNLLTTVLKAPMSFFTTTDIGITINRFSQDLQLVDMDLPLAALNTSITAVLVIAQMAIIGVESVYAAVSFPLCLGVFYLVQRFYLRTSRQMRHLDLETKSPLYSQFLECLSGLATIRAFGWQKPLAEKNLAMLERSQKPFYLFWAIQRWLTLVLDLVVAGIAVLLITLVVSLRGKLSPGAVGVVLYNVILFSTNIKLLLQFWTNLETHIGAVARIKTFTEETLPEDQPSEKDTPPDTWPATGAIEFRNVFAAHKASNLVLKDITLSVKAGSKVAICGRTGSGKSSLLASMFRMLDVCAGSVVVDGINLATIPRQTLRNRLIGVPQDTMLLPGNVRFNLDPAGRSVDANIIETLKSVELWKIVEEKGGLDAKVEDIFLTHGQRQLFCLARSMIRSSTILVLDEATSSVDGKTDALMQRLIRQKFAHHTIIAVAHKLETILDFDQIVLLDAGCVKEVGAPHDLLANEDSEFSKLYRQFSSPKTQE